MKKALVISIICSLYTKARAQDLWNELGNKKRFNYYVNGSFGFYLPLDAAKAIASRGGYSGFQFQVNYRDNWLGRLFFEQINVKYEDAFIVNGLNTGISEKVNTIAFGFDVGYTFHLNSRLASFIYGGAGYASMDVPKITYQTFPSQNLKIQTINKSFLMLRSGFGLEYAFTKIFILYTDFQFNSIPFKTDISEKRLNGINVQIGFKTPLQ